MANNGKRGPSLSKIRDAIRDVEKELRDYTTTKEDEHFKTAGLNFLQGLSTTLQAFCLRWSDGKEVLDLLPDQKKS
jgi:hypothetical protein